MTFRGNLLLYSLWYELHPFENLRRKGHHCHGLTHLSWAERKIFYRVLGKKFCGLFIYPGQSVRQVVAVSAPGDRDSYGCVAPAGNEQGPAATTESACAKRRCPLHPGGLLPGCRSAGHGATRVARPERSLQARGFHASDRSDSPKPRQRVRRRLAGAQQLPVGVGPDDRMPPGSREPKVRPADRTTLQ
ncbi:hypothetical protein MS6194_05039 [Escherichia coli]|nr:hypothetical protein [Escherichia coli]